MLKVNTKDTIGRSPSSSSISQSCCPIQPTSSFTDHHLVKFTWSNPVIGPNFPKFLPLKVIGNGQFCPFAVFQPKIFFKALTLKWHHPIVSNLFLLPDSTLHTSGDDSPPRRIRKKGGRNALLRQLSIVIVKKYISLVPLHCYAIGFCLVPDFRGSRGFGNRNRSSGI